MDGEAVRGTLGQLAEGLAEAIAVSPRISRAVGPALRRRLRSDDWIKSPMLVSFLRRLKPPSPFYNPPEVYQHALARFGEFPAGATSLHLLESVLEQFENHSVSGTENWMEELGDHRGYWLDKRLQSWGFEMAAMPRLESSRITKLRKRPALRTPDYIVRAPGMTIVMDAKLIFGPTWPFKILQTMLEALGEAVGWTHADEVFVHAARSGIDSSILDNEVAGLRVETLIETIERVVTGSSEAALTPNLIVSRRTPRERELHLRAFSARLPATRDEEDALFASLRTPPDTICHAAEDAWEQCAQYAVPHEGQVRLDAAVVGSENLPGLTDFGRTELALRQWLRTEVWPKHPFRTLCLYLTGLLQPVWLSGP